MLEAGAKTQVFVPPMPEGAWEPAELYNKMTVQGETEAGPLLDAERRRRSRSSTGPGRTGRRLLERRQQGGTIRPCARGEETNTPEVPR